MPIGLLQRIGLFLHWKAHAAGPRPAHAAGWSTVGPSQLSPALAYWGVDSVRTLLQQGSENHGGNTKKNKNKILSLEK
jgi:hypothetical protein